MELRHLRYFAAVARERHFTRAARTLHIAQPALSQQIAQLERALGVALLDRANRRVRLTPAGEALLIRADRILADVERAEEEMGDRPFTAFKVGWGFRSAVQGAGAEAGFAPRVIFESGDLGAIRG